MTHPKAWPCDIGTRRGTNDDIGLHLHRVHAGPLEIEPSELPHAARQAADEQAQHRAFMQAQAGSREGCADDEPADEPMTPSEAAVLTVVMLLSGATVVAGIAVIWRLL